MKNKDNKQIQKVARKALYGNDVAIALSAARVLMLHDRFLDVRVGETSTPMGFRKVS